MHPPRRRAPRALRTPTQVARGAATAPPTASATRGTGRQGRCARCARQGHTQPTRQTRACRALRAPPAPQRRRRGVLRYQRATARPGTRVPGRSISQGRSAPRARRGRTRRSQARGHAPPAPRASSRRLGRTRAPRALTTPGTRRHPKTQSAPACQGTPGKAGRGKRASPVPWAVTLPGTALKRALSVLLGLHQPCLRLRQRHAWTARATQYHGEARCASASLATR
mmetsp:Transcript_6450/g.15244  ORF Transcript_6450/g.15244 Transcript_6450/m.15244 type:complete len:226 (-) Transcript_6450:60-737(-)